MSPGLIAERDEIGPMSTARDTVLDREVASLDGNPVVAVVKRVALTTFIGAKDDSVVASGDLVGALGVFLENQEWTRRWRVCGIVVPVRHDEPRAPLTIDRWSLLEDHRFETCRQLPSDVDRKICSMRRGYGNEQKRG